MKHFKFITILLMMLMTQSALSQIEVDGIYYYYINSEESGMLTVASGSYSGDVVIPAQVIINSRTYSVTSIGGAFYGCSGLTSINIPDGVTSIGDGAFYGCSGLTSITIPENSKLTSIGDDAFFGCSSLTSITIPDGVTNIGAHAFSGCSGLTSITIPENSKLTSIGNYAFLGCRSLTSINIPDGVTNIGAHAFRDCSSLTSVTIPENSKLTSIGNYAFYDCSGLTSIIIPSSVTSIGAGAFCRCSGLTSITIPENSKLTSIGWSAFEDCRSLTSITIPDGVTSIGNYAFYGCSGLTSITIPDGVTSIGGDVFYGCSGLTSITIPDGVTSIGGGAFENCSGLTSVTFPENSKLTSIGDDAFLGCSSLTSITIPDGVTSIGQSAFWQCDNLISIVMKGNTPPTLGSQSFPWGKLLIVPSESLNNYAEANVSDYIYSTEDGKLVCGKDWRYNRDTKTLSVLGDDASGWWSQFNSEIHNVEISEGVTSIGEYAFCGCSGLTSIVMKAKTPPTIGDNSFPSGIIIIVPSEALDDYAEANVSDYIYSTEDGKLVCGKDWRYNQETKTLSVLGDVSGQPWSRFESEILNVDISEGVTSIGRWAFSSCKGLTSIIIPESVSSIEDYAFQSCSGLTSITIPENVTSIGYNAFYGCYGLKSITMKAKTPPTLGDNAIPSGKLLIVPSKSLDDYMEAYGSSYIYSTDDGKLVCGKDWRYNQETKTLSVLGDVSGQPWSQFRSEILNVEFSEGVTSIGSSAFSMCVGLTSVVIPESVTNIGSSAFYGCSGLTSVTIPDGVASIGGSVFQGCESLTSIAIPKSVTEIGDNIIRGCTNITSVTVDEENEHFDSRNNCNAIIKKEGNVLLSGCKNTIIPAGVDSIGSRAFQDANGIKRIIIPEGVTGIGRWAFMDCKNVELVYLPSTIKYLEGVRSGYAFAAFTEDLEDICICKDVYIAATTPPEIRQGTFYATKENILHVPVGYKEVYEAAEYWSDFTIVEGLELPNAIEEIYAERYGQKVIKTIENGRIVIIRDGVRYDITGRKL